MKRSHLVVVALALAVSPLVSATAYAHGGGLNAQGCHNNRKTGDYHCHRAQKAKPKPKPTPSNQSNLTGSKVANTVYYRNCTEARAAGAAPVRRNDPGYGKHLDRDGDGIGCE